MKIKSRILIVFAVLVAVATVASALAIPAFAVKEDYSNPNSTERVVLDSADVLELALGIELSDAEGEYLSLFGGESISYGEHVPTSYVMSEYLPEQDTLIVIAKAYEYITESGFRMTWTPVRAVVGSLDQVLMLDGDGSYSATFVGAGAEGTEKVTVFYSTTIAVSRNTINSIINLAYNDAARWTEYAESLAAKEQYAADMLAYEEYLTERSIYSESYAAYAKYLAELAEYESALALYENYEAALAEYNQKYSAYIKYLDEKAEYDKKLALYEEYLKNIETVAYQLSLIDGVKNTSTALKRAVYNAIIGDTVTQVIENKDAIANNLTGIRGEVIDLAGTSTENLRALFADYFALTDETDKYLYYALNYEKFRDNFTNLLRTLDLLYSNGKVRVALGEREGMKEKYEILLAQLYYVVTSLNDEPVSKYDGSGRFDSSYKILGKTPLSILGEAYMEDKNNAEPLSHGYPVKVEVPSVTTEVEKPIKPTPVQSPTPPKAVADPGEPPAEVVRPVPPTTVDAPYRLDDPSVLPAAVENLITAYEGGMLQPRDDVTENKSIALEITAEKKFLNVDEILIRFYGTGGEPLDVVNAERHSYVEFSGALPTKPADDYATYRFIGWQDKHGNIVDMTAVNCEGAELELYPAFSCDYKLYEVKWVVDGVETSTYCRLDEIPTFDGTPERPDYNGVYYEFAGWDREPSPVTANSSDNVYRAMFNAKFIVPLSNGSGASVKQEDELLIVDCTSSSQKRFDLSRLISRAARSTGIRLIAKSYTLEISYSDVIKMQDAGVSEISVMTVQRIGGYGFTVYFYDGEGSAVSADISVTVTLPFRFADPANMRVYYDTGAGREFIRGITDEQSLTATVLTGVLHYAITEYSLDTIRNDALYSITIDKTTATSGERVKFYCHAITGYEIVSVFLIGVDGVETPIEPTDIEGCYEFLMPSESVSVGIDCRAIMYTVKFVSEGKVLSSNTYKYGEIPVVPNAPVKVSDGDYRYEFVCWNPQIAPATSDRTYRALYRAIPLPVKEKPTGLIISDSVKQLLARAITLGVYLCVILLPATVITVTKIAIVRRRYPRRRVKKTPKS